LIGGRNAQESNDPQNAPLVTRNDRLERAHVARTSGLDKDVVLRVVFGQNELLFPRASTAMTE
jgi:hypothetical protein